MNESRENLTKRVKISKQNAQSLSDRLKATFQEKNKSQREIAKELEISENALSNYVTGKRTPSATLLNKIARLYEEDVQWLISGVRFEGLIKDLTVDLSGSIIKTPKVELSKYLSGESTIKEGAGHEEPTASGALAKEQIDLKQRIGRLIMLRKIKDDDGRTVTVEREQFVDVLIESLDALSLAELRRLADAIRPLLNYKERAEQDSPRQTKI